MRKLPLKLSFKFIALSKHIFYFSGLKYIWEKINPKNRETPATFPLWFIGIYIALFGIASNRYENKVEKVENRISALVAQMSSNDLNVFKGAVTNISTIQRSKIPFRPDILSPKSVFISFFREAEQDDESFMWLKQIVENHRSKFEDVYLAGINLQGAWLPNGNFKNSDLWDSDFSGAIILYCNFENTNLRVANFENTKGIGSKFMHAKLEETRFSQSYFPQVSFEGVNAEKAILSNSILVQANFQKSILKNVNFDNSNLMGALFKNTDFSNVSFNKSILVGADFTGSNVTFHDLEKARSLYAAILPLEVSTKIKENKPELLIKPPMSFPDPFVKMILEKHSKHIFQQESITNP